jgi:methylase of polypeptide subunit release factors
MTVETHPDRDAARRILEALSRAGSTALFGTLHDQLGGAFQQRLGRRARHASGQYYTRPEVADLACAFAIRRSDAAVLDPACGSGAFLLRALARLGHLDPDGRSPRRLHGVDLSPTALWLAAVNLAGRGQLARGSLVRGDFFEQEPGAALPLVDAVVGNPPYVQQEDLPAAGPGSKRWIRERVFEATGANLSGRSDLHGFFWPQAARFLRPGGRLALITSSPWLDAGYGAGLRRWMLDCCAVEAVIESADEPWFDDARVLTALTVLRVEPRPEHRRDNLVRFVQLRQPLSELLPATDPEALHAADALREDVMAASGDMRVERFALRSVPQADLEPGAGRIEGKWGRHLRGPRLWFELRRATGDAWTPLGDRVRLRRGLTTGCDRFFFLRGRRSGLEGFDGRTRDIEPRFLRPEIHSSLEVRGFSVRAADCRRSVLLAGDRIEDLTGTAVLEYIRAGEAAGLHRGATCAGRARGGRAWYDLTGHDPAPLLWPKERQYRHVVPLNPDRLPASCRFYELHPPGEDLQVWAAVLNSSWALLASLLYGRPMGNEGNHSVMAADLRGMPVPDPRAAGAAVREELIRSFEAMAARPPLAMLSERRLRRMALSANSRHGELDGLDDHGELDQDDRRRLDRAVLALLGVTSPTEQDQWLERLHGWLADHFERSRAKEERAMERKTRGR